MHSIRTVIRVVRYCERNVKGVFYRLIKSLIHFAPVDHADMAVKKTETSFLFIFFYKIMLLMMISAITVFQ